MSQPKPEHSVKTPSPRAGLFATLRGLGGALAIVLAASAHVPSAQAACPNEAIRESQGALAKALPDCRAYELVSPGSNPKVSVNGVGTTDYSRASVTGNRLAYESYYPADNAPNSSLFYLSIRGADGWSTQPVAPQDTPTAGHILFPCYQEMNFSPDLSKSVLGDGLHTEPNCQSAEEELAPGAPSGYRNLFLREDATAGPYRLVNVTPESAVPNNALFVAGSADFSHIVFTDEAQLTKNAPAGATLYEWADGEVHLVTVLPGGQPSQGNIAGTASQFNSFAQAEHAVSPDGERVYFYAQGNLYMRVNAVQAPTLSGECSPAEPEKACTIQIDESHGVGSSGGGTFAEASADGAKAFFTDASQLTGDSHAEPGAPDLYEYDLDRPPSERLRDLTASEPAHVYGLAGTSEDGSYVYFSAAGVLTGAEENEHGEKAEPGKSNLYLIHGGETTFIAGDGAGGQVSPNGRFYLFTSRKSLTGYDNTPVEPEECRVEISNGVFEPAPCTELFLYDADTGRLSCASCGSEGSVPTGDNLLAAPATSGPSLPSATYPRRQIDDEGRIFFDTSNALVPQDQNGVRDVYEYGHGQIHLISSGSDAAGSSFYEASSSGNDVFFVTGQRLLPGDTNANETVYDARVGGGFPEPPPAPECEAEACRVGGTLAPGTSSWVTAHFVGPGNPKATGCKKGLVKKRDRCVKIRKHHHKRRHHPRAKPKRLWQANLNRGGLK